MRSPNAGLLAYTGCPDAIDWIEKTVAPPTTEHWGGAAALLGIEWPRLASWLATAGPTQLAALDALLAYRAPAPNMAPLAQIAAPVLPNPPAEGVLHIVLDATLALRNTPRVRKSVEAIRGYAPEILRGGPRGVPVEQLPSLYLDPETFPSAGPILSEADRVSAGFENSINAILRKLDSRGD